MKAPNKSKIRGLTRRRGRWYFVRRIPADLAGQIISPDGTPRKFVQIALRTDSQREAETRAALVAAEVAAEWDALRAGRESDARRHYLAARALCEARGYKYAAMSDLIGPDTDLPALIARVMSLSDGADLTASPAQVEAVLGAVPRSLSHLGEIFETVAEATKTERMKNTPQQEKIWRAPRLAAIKSFTDLAGDLPVNEYSREDALAWRDWWAARVADGAKINSANKQLQWLGKMVRLWCDHRKISPAITVFDGLSLRGDNSSRRPAYSRDFVAGKILAPGALDRLNPEARDVLLVMINTALGPGEILGAALDDWDLRANIPHVKIHAQTRTLKTSNRARSIPLLGVSLEAARRIVDRGGIQKYWRDTNKWSAVTSKFMKNNGLKEGPRHTPYSLRHYAEDQLKITGCDYEVRLHIFGHASPRPEYGETPLEVLRDALERIAL